MSMLARSKVTRAGFRAEEITRFVTAYGPKFRQAQDFSEEVDMAKQSFKDECDVNRIMAKALKGQPVSWLNPKEPRWGVDVTGVDFRESMDVVAKSIEMFDQLPSAVRKKFQNDPAQFLEFIDNKDNEEEIYKMGLAKRAPPPPVPEPIAVRVVADPPA